MAAFTAVNAGRRERVRARVGSQRARSMHARGLGARIYLGRARGRGVGEMEGRRRDQALNATTKVLPI